jgi:hypothetical protein
MDRDYLPSLQGQAVHPGARRLAGTTGAVGLQAALQQCIVRAFPARSWPHSHAIVIPREARESTRNRALQRATRGL